jgi:pimeloyl-ACP methyl ester carboxylesterase
MRAQGIERFHVAGCSLGGGVALELARQRTALTATALSPAGFHEGWDAWLLHGSIAVYRAAARALAPVAETVMAPVRVRRALLWQGTCDAGRWPPDYTVRLLRSVATAPGYRAAARHALHERFRNGHELRGIPVTVAWAEHDRLLLRTRQAPRARAELPHARHVLLRGCGHVPFYDDPDQVAAVIRHGSERA